MEWFLTIIIYYWKIEEKKNEKMEASGGTDLTSVEPCD